MTESGTAGRRTPTAEETAQGAPMGPNALRMEIAWRRIASTEFASRPDVVTTYVMVTRPMLTVVEMSVRRVPLI